MSRLVFIQNIYYKDKQYLPGDKAPEELRGKPFVAEVVPDHRTKRKQQPARNRMQRGGTNRGNRK